MRSSSRMATRQSRSLSTLRQKFSFEEWQSHLQELNELERYACQLLGDNPDTPGLKKFQERWSGKDVSTANTYQMIRELLLLEMNKFKDHILQVLALQRQRDLGLLRSQLRSTSKESTTTDPSPLPSSMP